jgi:hypothetical protein
MTAWIRLDRAGARLSKGHDRAVFYAEMRRLASESAYLLEFARCLQIAAYWHRGVCVFNPKLPASLQVADSQPRS